MALELLAPAKNLEQGTLALRCGADAVYMGGPQFGARQAAGNELADFEQLTREARLWGAKVYATLNTLLYDHELEEARRQAWSLFEAGVDALIIQDMAYLEMDLPPLPLHASTQAACDSPERVAFLASAGFTRAILARELSLDDIRAIRGAADMELEAFVYGALCVGESGHCYLSGAICDRSGNRGECAQPCRAPWNLVDGAGRVVVREKHLLNIRDLDLSGHLDGLAEAGVTSFKIEGRLKDADYVKNVVSHVRRNLDDLLARLSPALKLQQFNIGTGGFGYDAALNLKAFHWDFTCIHGVNYPNGVPGARPLNVSVFPHAIAQAASFDVDLVARLSAATLYEARAIGQFVYRESGGELWTGTSCDGGPLANSVHDSRWGRISECYGEDPSGLPRAAAR